MSNVLDDDWGKDDGTEPAGTTADDLAVAWEAFVGARLAYRQAVRKRDELQARLSLGYRAKQSHEKRQPTVSEVDAHVLTQPEHAKVTDACELAEAKLWLAIGQLDVARMRAGRPGSLSLSMGEIR